MSNNKKIRRRIRCPQCGSLDVIKWGVRNGVQRHKCRSCKTLFSSRRKDISKSNRLPWFRKWVLGKMSVEELSAASGYSSSSASPAASSRQSGPRIDVVMQHIDYQQIVQHYIQYSILFYNQLTYSHLQDHIKINI